MKVTYNDLEICFDQILPTEELEARLLEFGWAGLPYQITYTPAEQQARIRQAIASQAGDTLSLLSALSDVVCKFLPTILEIAKERGGSQSEAAIEFEKHLNGYPVDAKPWPDVAKSFCARSETILSLLSGAS